MRQAPLKLHGVYGAVPAAEIIGRDHKEMLWPKENSVKLFSVSREKVTLCAYTRSFIS